MQTMRCTVRELNCLYMVNKRERKMEAVIQQTIFLGMLGLSAYKDYRNKKVSLYCVLLQGIVGVILHILFQERSLADILAGMGIGAVVLIMSWVSGGKIGLGDGMILVISGIFLGFWKNLELFMVALLFSGMWALFLLTVKKKGRNYRMPFLPFLLAAYLFMLI